MQAAQILAGSGYADVSNVAGGYGGGRAEGWTQAGLPSESGAGTGQSYEDLRARATRKP
jgi:hypothetical protein